MTNDLIAEINKRFKRSITKDPNTLTCIVTGKSRPTNSEYLEGKIGTAGTKERFVEHYICRDALTLLRKGKTIEEVRQELSVDVKVPIPTNAMLETALEINGK
jgi:hypothetical protein